MKRTAILACAIVSSVLVAVAPASAAPLVLDVGVLSFDNFIPADGGPGVNVFSITNLTDIGLDPLFLQVLTFGNLTLTITGEDPSAGGLVSIADLLGPGTLLGSDGNPLPTLQFPDTVSFSSASLDGAVDLTSFLLLDGTLFTPHSLSALLLPSSGAGLTVGDFAFIELSGEQSEATPVPEAGTLTLVGTGVAAMVIALRRSRQRKPS